MDATTRTRATDGTSLSDRLDSLEARSDRDEAAIDRLSDRLDSLEAAVATMKAAMDRLEAAVTAYLECREVAAL